MCVGPRIREISNGYVMSHIANKLLPGDGSIDEHSRNGDFNFRVRTNKKAKTVLNFIITISVPILAVKKKV